MAVENYTARFNDAAWLKPRDIVLGGAGGINSWVALSLARIGHKLTIYDMDRYEDVNIAGQFCTEKDINVNKATALVKNLLAFTGTSHHSAMKEYKVNSFVSPIMISGFDNMAARKLMFEKWKAQEDREIFIDGRMTMESFSVFAVTKGKEEDYEKTLFDDADASILSCSAKASTHNAMGISYIITGVLNNFLVADPTGFRVVPFCTDMDISLFMFEINE